jgi:hypothetical protein
MVVCAFFPALADGVFIPVILHYIVMLLYFFTIVIVLQLIDISPSSMISFSNRLSIEALAFIKALSIA